MGLREWNRRSLKVAFTALALAGVYQSYTAFSKRLSRASQEVTIQSCLTGSAVSFISPFMRATFSNTMFDEQVTIYPDAVRFSFPTAHREFPYQNAPRITDRIDIENYWVSLDKDKALTGVNTGHYDRWWEGKYDNNKYYVHTNIVPAQDLEPKDRQFLVEMQRCVVAQHLNPS